MELKYIELNSPLYKAAVAIRTQLFFDKMANSSTLIHDELEAKGLHLVCVNENEVIGTGRLNIEKNVSIISQMAIKDCYQNKGIGSYILKALIEKSKALSVTTIKLSARETAITFYEKFNFKAIGKKYPSTKTGIVHQQMVLMLE